MTESREIVGGVEKKKWGSQLPQKFEEEKVTKQIKMAKYSREKK